MAVADGPSRGPTTRWAFAIVASARNGGYDDNSAVGTGGDAAELNRAIRTQFDPRGILNAGRFWT